jgi:hypothetical protein
MVREVAIVGAAMVALQLACPSAQSAPATAAQTRHPRHTAIAVPHTATAQAVAVRPPTAHKKVVRQVAHAPAPSAKPQPLEAAMQLATPDVDTADGAPTPLAFHVVRAIAEPAQDTGGSPKSAHHDTAAAEPAVDIPVLPSTPPMLTRQESEAGQMANAHGDKTFVMIDKARGKIILFENGQPVFAGPALTGQSTADEIPKKELGEKFDNLNAPNTKITPAGRYTVQRGFDPEVGGPLFDIPEIRGKDWGIAIHQLYLGIPSEHRDVRILSSNDEDKHITYGCINITTPTMRVLLHQLPAKGPIPLYILPQDSSQTAAYLTPRTAS